MSKRGAIDAVYWRLHSAFLRNRREEADKFLEMLEGESQADILDELGLAHYGRYGRIRERIWVGVYGRLHDGGYEAPEGSYAPKGEKSGLERAFCKALLSDWRSFTAALGAGPCNIVPELDLGEFGRVDFLLREGRRWHVIEVKMGEAPFSVVSQIYKYILAAELDMCLGLHDEVRPAVIAEYFPSLIRSELARMNVSMIHHKGTPESLRRIS